MLTHESPVQRGADVPDDLPPGWALRRTVNYERSIADNGREITQQIADNYTTGDELGYLAFKALKEHGGGRRMFTKALTEGIDAVDDPPQELVDLFAHADRVPDWVDWEQLRRGSVAYWRAGKFTVMGLAYAAIGAGFRTYGGSRPLVLSRRLIRRDQVGRRLVETLRWAANASAPDGMRRDADGFRLTMEVRWIHAAVRHHLATDPNWDWDDWGLVVSNTDSVYTMGVLFCEAVIDALRKAGVQLTPDERDAIVALWRYIGHIMGIPESINFRDWSDLRRKSAVIRMLEHPSDAGCRALITSLIDYMCEETIDGYEVLPPLVDRRLTPGQKRRLTHGLMWSWAGPEICEQLHIPKNRLRFLLPTARPFLAGYDRLTRRLPHDDEARAREALAAFGVALQTSDGELELADPDEVTRDFAEHGANKHELLGA